MSLTDWIKSIFYSFLLIYLACLSLGILAGLTGFLLHLLKQGFKTFF